MEKKKPHVVFIPVPAQSHIKCMLKLARLLHHKGLHITFVNTQSNHNRLLKSAHDLDETAGFQFKAVPDGLSSKLEDEDKPGETLYQISDYLNANFLDSFLALVAGLETPVNCIISDGLMVCAKTPLAAEMLGVPIMLYWTMAASGFMAYYQAKVLMEKGIVPLKDESFRTNGYIDTEIDWIPGMEGIRLRDLPDHMLATKPDDYVLNLLVEASKAADKVSHIIIHSFDELEATLIKELKAIFLHIYTVGPQQLLLNRITENETVKSKFYGYSLWKEEPQCVQWLQSKEPDSVVYVNFGSLTVMSLQDLLEFGWGLVNSNQYFLWIIRTNLVDGKPVVLPEELKEVIKARGFIASWCSQEEVLNRTLQLVGF